MQQFDLVEWGGRMDWDITLFPETGSGMKKTRPVLESLMNALRRKEFEALVVWKLDRLARSVSHLVSIYEELNELGIKLYSYKEPEINPETAMGKAMIGVMAVMAQLERDFISERTKAGLHAKKRWARYWAALKPNSRLDCWRTCGQALSATSPASTAYLAWRSSDYEQPTRRHHSI